LRGEWELAQASLERVLEIRLQVGHAAGIVDAYVHLGRIAEARGALDHAQAAYVRAVDACEAMDAGPCVAGAHRALGLLLLRRDDVAGAAAHIGKAVALARDMPASLEYAAALLAEVRLHQYNGAREAALAAAARVLTAPQTAVSAIEAHVAFAEVLIDAGQPDEAAAQAALATRAAELLASPPLLGAAYRVAGLAAAAQGRRAEAAVSLQTAAQHYAAARSPHEQARVEAEYQQLLQRASASPSTAV
jgi:tetratricopeptide (TPR) repeat protein